ncbi:hypothetical protein V6N11_019814 [Hibiscus sabdariffa]|uniref:RNase H type-1 domain-containing protein n=1 Tax=Hibiscus sabdariffa TaxID=183260 RepID=A0ABR1ZCM2_9ROSI
MDRLGHSITDAVNSGDWTPFRFARNGTALSHLFFADDLVLYAKADTEQARRIANILNLFGASSGHRVSSRKSQILFSSNTPSHIQQEIGDILGDYARDSLDATNHVSFDSVLTANGDWDVAKLAQIFTEDALPYIIGVKPPSPQGGSDRCIWRIHQFWRRAWYVDLIWVPRSSNQAADSMARIANCSSFNLLFFSDPPAQLHDVLTTDALVLSL